MHKILIDGKVKVKGENFYIITSSYRVTESNKFLY